LRGTKDLGTKTTSVAMMVTVMGIGGSLLKNLMKTTVQSVQLPDDISGIVSKVDYQGIFAEISEISKLRKDSLKQLLGPHLDEYKQLQTIQKEENKRRREKRRKEEKDVAAIVFNEPKI
jgi:hypothetical protein